MASNSGQTTATASAGTGNSEDVFASDIWEFVDCCKCHADVIVPDPQTGGTAVQPDFTILGCTHIVCDSCLNGLTQCPNCGAPSLQEDAQIPIIAAQSVPTIGAFFRSPALTLETLASTLSFQRNLLTHHASYYKQLSSRQAGVLKSIKDELRELREMKKSYDALCRENAALKAQLGESQAYPPDQRYLAPSDVIPRSGRSTPIMQTAQNLPAAMQTVRRSANSTPMPQQGLQIPTSLVQPQRQFALPPVSRGLKVPSRTSMNTPQPGHDPASLRNMARSVPPAPIASAGVKRSLPDVDKTLAKLPKRMREDMLGVPISSADHHRQQAEAEPEPQHPSSGSTRRAIDLNQFRNPQTSGQQLREQMQPPARETRKRHMQNIQVIPEEAPSRRPARQEKQAVVDEEEMYYNDAIDDQDLPDERMLQPPQQQRQPAQYSRNDGFVPAGQYDAHQAGAPQARPATKSGFKQLIPNGAIPAQPNDRSYQPAGSRSQQQHGRTGQNAGASSFIRPAPLSTGGTGQQSRSLPRGRVGGGGQGQRNNQTGQRIIFNYQDNGA